MTVLSVLKVNGKYVDLPRGSLVNVTSAHNVTVSEKWVGWGRCIDGKCKMWSKITT